MLSRGDTGDRLAEVDEVEYYMQTHIYTFRYILHTLLRMH